MDYKKVVAQRIKQLVDLDIETIENLIEIPPRPEMGEFAFPCFQLAKNMKKAPNMIANDLKGKIENDGFEKIECFGPYLNFFLDKGVFIKNTVEKKIGRAHV